MTDKPKLSVFDDAELETSKTDEQLNRPPNRGSDEWQDYVLSLLREDEYVEKNGIKYPKCSGLRRLTEELLGSIMFSGPVSFHPPSEQNKFNATVAYRVVISFYLGEPREYVEVADAGPLNTPEKYALHPSATASSRAAGRAFRNALLLSVNTAEEMSNVIDNDNGLNDDMRLLNEPITAAQIIGIKTISSRLNINIDKFLNLCGLNKSLDKLLKSEGEALMAQLHRFSQDNIPDGIKDN